jgi:hypothetical protein
MKEDEFQSKLEIILKTFYDIDQQVKKYLGKQDYHLYAYKEASDDQYNEKK